MASIKKEVPEGEHDIKYTLLDYSDEAFGITVIANEAKTYHKTLTSILPKGRTDLSRSDIPDAIYLETKAIFSIFTENTGDVKARFKITVLFEAVAIVKEYNFKSAWSTEIAPNKTTMIDVNILMPSDAIPEGKGEAHYEITTILEAE